MKKGFLFDYNWDATGEKFFIQDTESREIIETFFDDYSFREYLKDNGYEYEEIDSIIDDLYARLDVPF